MKNKINPLAYMTKTQAKFLLIVLEEWRKRSTVEEHDLYHEASETLNRIATATYCDLFKALPEQDESTLELFAKLDAVEEDA